MKIVSLVGARPQFVKEAMLGQAVRDTHAWQHVLVHSGQHYDLNMSDIFFQELGIPQPEYHLGIGSGSHAAMTAAALTGLEDVLLTENPDALLVYGDTNTTLAGALAAAKLNIPVIHVEAGIRMLPRSMPEEINRVLTDRISALMCCCSELGLRNLAAEGITQGVTLCGDLMYDVYCHMQKHFDPAAACPRFGLEAGRFALATIHRDYNTDNPVALSGIFEGLAQAQAATGVAMAVPLHPRTRKRLKEQDLWTVANHCTLLDPLGYVDLLSLVRGAAFVVTDSGGLQKEAYYAGKRCAVVMPDTGWTELTDTGWNILVAAEAEALAVTCQEVSAPLSISENIYGDGRAAHKIIAAVKQLLG
jgi:UDP-N-acetylglucosamine 2-epimerase (non-hydrolysing)